MVFLWHQFSGCQEEASRTCETVAFWLNNKRWRLTVNWCESWSQMNYGGDKMECWRNHWCLLISYHRLLLSRSIKCCSNCFGFDWVCESAIQHFLWSVTAISAHSIHPSGPHHLFSGIFNWAYGAWNNKFSLHCNLIATKCLQAFKQVVHV